MENQIIKTDNEDYNVYENNSQFNYDVKIENDSGVNYDSML